MAIIQSGYFTSTGVAKTLVLRSDVDYLVVTNETEMAATTTAHGFRYYWRRGMTQGLGNLEKHVTVDPQGINVAGVVFTGAIAANSGFFLVDSSNKTPGAAVVVTGGTDATRPVYTVASIGSVLAGSIVRIIGGNQTNLAGLDFSVDDINNGGVNFRLANTIATAPGTTSGACTYRMVAQDLATYKYFYPSNRFIANITQAAAAVVTTLVDHGYTTGDKVRLNVPSEFGMTQMNGLLGTVTYLTASTFSVDIDSTAFTAFKFPLPAIVPFTYAEVVCVGGVSSTTSYSDAIANGLYIGITLMPGVLSPAGSTFDVISWQAYKSDNL